MNKKISTKVAMITFAVFALFVSGIIFASSRSQNFSISEDKVIPIPQKNNGKVGNDINNPQNSEPTTEMSNISSAEDQVQVSYKDSNYIVSAPLAVPISDAVRRATEIAGFQVYCPTFFPKEFKKYMTIIEIYSDKRSAYCSIEDASPNTTFAPIIIEESPIKNADGKRILEWLDSFDSKKEVDINGNKGYAGTYRTGTTVNNGATYSNLIYLDGKGTAVSIDSSYYSIDILLKIARSMQ